MYKASGGEWGGTQVDKRFMAMLQAVLGRETMGRFQKECLYDVFDLLKEFEIVKRTINPDTTELVKVRLPYTLREINLEEKEGLLTSSQLRKKIMETITSPSIEYAGKITIKKDKMKVDAEFARNMFMYSIDELLNCIKDIFQNDEIKVDTILVVGGFSECSLVQHAFRSVLKDKKVVFPSDPGLVVLKGAVLFGHDPKVIASRKARFTYGIKYMADFIDGVHDKRQQLVVNGEKKCDNLFMVYVKKNMSVEPGFTTVSEKHTPSPRDIHGGYVKIRMYLSTQSSPMYVTDPQSKFMGELDVKLPTGENKDYEISLIFGDAEVMLVVKHVDSEERFSKYFNFR